MASMALRSRNGDECGQAIGRVIDMA